ncbi:MAG: DUF2617 family protein [Chitinophagaceae bacterium]|nr:DUF2617 family protein [Anaerolineae bacterium]
MNINSFDTQISVTPTDQQPTDLMLAISIQDISEQVNVLKQQSATFDNLQLTFYIIGESHIVRLERDDTLLFQEVLACIDLPEQDCLYHHRFNDLSAHTYQQKGYQVQVDFKPIHHAMLPYTPDGLLEVAFPKTRGQIPITRIQWWLKDDVLYWWSLHTYPDWEITQHVYTLSSFSLKKG